ncbi:hypothetical protein PI124_g22913, partial [Phytophthora idaei]
MAAEAEAALNALKKMEANKTCVNCGNYNRFGHQNICEKPNGGGNAVAARVWLGRWVESQMRKPTKDDPLDYYKQFINRV